MPTDIVSISNVPDYGGLIGRAADLIRSGRIVVLPTETVYGAFGSLNSQAARDQIKSLRDSAENKPFTPHLANADQAAEFIGAPSDTGARLMRKLWPGPVGLQFEVSADLQAKSCQRFGVEPAALFVQGLVTLRCPDHPVFNDVAREAGHILIATQAGTGHDPASIFPTIADKVDLVIDAGPTRFAKPSTLIRIHGDSYSIVRAGVYDERIIQKLLKTTILFVCSGNTCRSPMAEAIARKVIAGKLEVPQNELEVRGYEVLSAGAMAYPGARATPEAVEAVGALGGDLSRHRSQTLSVELVHHADHVFVMSKSHLRAVLSMAPAAAKKIHTLDPNDDIEDPIGGDITLYRELAGHMETLIDQQLTQKQVV